ncbi:MFS transporter [Pustulibacterium marinum]|nr:MFS transporter [Pustulibacterium marinum]
MKGLILMLHFSAIASYMIFKKSLISLAIGGFGIGLTEFVMMGILPDLAKDFNITIPEAGHFISAYAIGVMIGAPILVMIAGNFPPKKILVALMMAFTVFNGLSIFAPSYELMMVTRLLSGLPHGAFFGVGAVVASRLVDKSKEASAVAMMLGGLTIANIFGIPLGTYVGHNISWRLTFAMVAFVGLLAITSIYFWMPNLEKRAKTNPLNDLRVFKNVEPWLILGITAIGTGGFFAWYSYVTPLLTEVSGFEDTGLTIVGILALAGLGMTFGNFAGGKLADVVSPAKATAVLLAIMGLCLLGVSFAAESQVLTLVMVFVTGFFAFSTASPIQMLMINASKGSEMLASAANQAGFNLGNAIGAFLGGLPIAAGLGYTSPEWVGAGLAYSGVVITLIILIRRNRNSKAAAV